MKKSITLFVVLIVGWTVLWVQFMSPAMEADYLASGGTYDGWALQSFSVCIMVGFLIGIVTVGVDIARDWW